MSWLFRGKRTPSDQLEYSRSGSPLGGVVVVPRLEGTAEPFLASLADAIAWCSARSSPRELWHAALRPRVLSTGYAESVGTVLGNRRFDLGSREPPPSTSLGGGKLMVYFPSADLADGAAEVQSGGFFDVCNCPPPGTWVGWCDDRIDDPSYSEYLIAWVPNHLIEPVDAGIEVNPERCIQWLNGSTARFAKLCGQSPALEFLLH